MPYHDKITVRELLALARKNDLDVPEVQRTFVERQQWVVDLVDSLRRGIPIGQVLIWHPDDQHRPRSGRYEHHSESQYRILNGQQRITALLAALGIRPSWIPDDRWNRMVREMLLSTRRRQPCEPVAAARGTCEQRAANR